MKKLLAFSLMATAFSLAYAESADVIYENGVIYRHAGDPTSKVDALAIKDGRVLALGTAEAMQAHKGSDTKVVDLAHQVVMPGFIDAHAHYVRGALRDLYSCTLPSSVKPDDIADLVADCAQDLPEGQWLTGGPMPQSYMDQGLVHRDMLDEVVGDNPVFLLDDTGHNGLVNSAALEVLGLDEDSAKDNDEVGKDKSGRLSGVLLESAAGAALKAIPEADASQYQEAAKWSVAKANRNGITAFAEGRTDRPTLAGYSSVDREEGLNADVVTYLQYDTDFNETHEFQDETVQIRQDYATPRVHVDHIKLYLDGVPPAFNALLLEPYEETERYGKDFYGEMRMTPERINEVVHKMDQEGVEVKMHATADGSVRAALDAVAYAREQGSTQKSHSIAHVGLVADNDLDRFRKLDVLADIAPPLWIPGPYSDSMHASIGTERYENYVPTHDLYTAGALVAYGSDWPSISFDINPWPHLASMVDRKIGAHQSVSLSEGFTIMTENAARALALEEDIGTLDAGKKANFIVIESDPYRIPLEELAELQAKQTFFEGRLVYECDDC